MKNQYFGDNRDLFKYDLVYQIIQAGLVDHFTFIPMLTKGPGDEDDRRKAVGRNNSDLVDFLNECRRKDGRNINQLENFFKDKITIYKKDDEDKYLSNDYRKRKDYFSQILVKTDDLLSKSLVLVDPDKGLEPEGKTKKEHVKYCEIKAIYKHMGKSSILMIFQDLARKSPNSYITQTFEKFNNELGANQPIYIHDGKTLFFFLAKDKSIRKRLAKTISDYKEKYESKLYVGGIS